MDTRTAVSKLAMLPQTQELEKVDWTYTMRREMQEIIPGLYLGPYSVASKSKLHSLMAAGITHIVCVRQHVQASHVRPNFPHIFKYLVLDLADDDKQNIIQYFPQVNAFILTSLQAGGKVLVHGVTGSSRSATLVLAFMMLHCGLTYPDAFVYLQSRRFCVSPNPNFVRQLEAYEPICKANRMQQPDWPTQHRRSLKRKLEEPEDTEPEMVCEPMS